MIIFCVLLFTFIYNNKFTKENKINVAISTFIAKFRVDEKDNKKVNENASEKTIETENEPISNIEIKLKDTDGSKTTYTFEYKDETFTAMFKNECWKIVDSYKIKNSNVMNLVCEALIKEHPVLGKDKTSYRTVGDMVYEWVQHNLAYSMLSEESEFKERAKDVDFDPDDQGRTFMEIYENRTGKKFSFSDIISSK